MSKERAARRAVRQAEQAAAAESRRRRSERKRRRSALARAGTAPLRRVAHRWMRFRRWWGRRSRVQRALCLIVAVAVVGGLVLAPTWGARLFVVGFSVLLFPVAWTLASGRR